jgi:hypothetical protein
MAILKQLSMVGAFAAMATPVLAQENISAAAPQASGNVIEMSQALDCHTNDGYAPNVMAMSSDGLNNVFGVRFGNADYTDDYGYRTVLDATHLPQASHLLQSFIVEHECAHHSLGHTYEAYDNGFVPADRFWSYEDDADCAALRAISRKYGYSGDETLTALFAEMESVNFDIIRSLSIEAEEMAGLLNELPDRMEARHQRAQLCPIY